MWSPSICCCLNCVFPRPGLPKLSPAVTSCQPVVSTWLPSLPRDSPPLPPEPRRAFQQAASGTDGIQDLSTPQSGGDPGDRPSEPRSRRDGAPDTQERSQRVGIREKERATGEEQRDRRSLESRDTHTHIHTHGGQTTKTPFHPPTVAPRSRGPPQPATQPPSLTRSLDTTSRGPLDGQSHRPRPGLQSECARLQESPEMRVYMTHEKCAQTHGAGL